MPKLPINLQFEGGKHERGYNSDGACIAGGYVDDKGVVVSQPGLTELVSANVSYLHTHYASAISRGDTFIVNENGRVDKVKDLDTTPTITAGSGDVLDFYTGIAFDHPTCADFGQTLYYAAGKKILKVNTTPVGAELTDVDIPTNVNSIAFFDQYMLATELLGSAFSRNNTLHWSDVGTPDAWSGDFGSAEYRPDSIRSFAIRNKEILILCDDSSEVWYNDGSTPFLPLLGAQTEVGCASQYSLVWCGDRYFWLSSKGDIVYSSGRGSTVFSQSLSNYLELRKQVGGTYFIPLESFGYYLPIEGKRFYIFNYSDITLDTTIACDIDTGSWYDWGRFNSSTDKYLRWKTRYPTTNPTMNLTVCGAYLRDGIFYMRNGVNDDSDGDDIRITIRTPSIDYGDIGKRKFPKRLVFEMVYKDADHDLPAASTTYDVYIKWRDEGIATWGTEHTVTCYPVGGGIYRGTLNRMGSYYARQYETYNEDILGYSSIMEEF